jgi:hypothetical protein
MLADRLRQRDADRPRTPLPAPPVCVPMSRGSDGSGPRPRSGRRARACVRRRLHLQLAAGQQLDDPPPNLHRADRIGGPVDQERRLLDSGQLRVVEGQPGSQSRASSPGLAPSRVRCAPNRSLARTPLATERSPRGWARHLGPCSVRRMNALTLLGFGGSRTTIAPIGDAISLTMRGTSLSSTIGPPPTRTTGPPRPRCRDASRKGPQIRRWARPRA